MEKENTGKFVLKADNHPWPMKRVILISCLFLTPVYLLAQDSASGKWSLTAGTEINSVATIDPKVVDSEGSSLSIAPYLKIMLHPGLGISAKTFFVTGGPHPGYYMTALSPFFSADNDRIGLDTAYTHFFLKHNEAIPYSPITNEVYMAFSYKSRSISPRVGFDYGFGTDTSDKSSKGAHDINIFAGLGHSFEWDLGENASLNFSPNLLLNMGTNRYFSFLRSVKYITHNKNFNKLVRGKNSGNGGGNNQSSNSLPNIGISNLEANLDFDFSLGNFSIEPEGSLFIPFKGDDQNIYGYWQISICYKLRK